MSSFSEVISRRMLYFMSPQMDIYKHIAERVEGQKVIDIGFGMGFGTLQLTSTAGEVAGVEFDREAVAFARGSIPGIRWEWGDISRGIHYLGSDYDAALLIEVLEHVSDWQLALVHVNDILKPGGLLYISARNANADLRKNDLHEREWTAEQFKNALGAYFKEVHLYDYQLKVEQDIDTRQTPLVAIARKEA